MIDPNECLPGQVLTSYVRQTNGGGRQAPVPVVIVLPEKPIGAPPSLLYKVDDYTMSAARADEEHRIQADYILLWTNGDPSDIRVRLNNKNADQLYMSRLNPIPGPADLLYLTHSAQAGKTVSVIALRNVASSFPMSAPVLQSITSISQVSFSRLKSDKDANFTGALATNAIKTENITGLAFNKIVIKRVSIQSDQQLNYALLFWAKDTFQTSDFDTDSFLGEVTLDLTAIGRRIAGAGQYYADLELNFQYQDDDGSRELHVGLLNLDATSKIAGATGEVVVEVFYEEAT